MKYRVYDTSSGKDVTGEKNWIVDPNGELGFYYYCGLCQRMHVFFENADEEYEIKLIKE